MVTDRDDLLVVPSAREGDNQRRIGPVDGELAFQEPEPHSDGGVFEVPWNYELSCAVDPGSADGGAN